MRSIGHSFLTLQSIDSTNNYAMAQVHAGLASHGNTYLALHQTNGKGQRGKEWKSDAGENIAVSIVLQPSGLSLTDQFMLIVAVAMGCYDLVKYYTNHHVSVKWPNDIYLGDRKAGGILIENVVRALDWQFAIAGIGINVNQLSFPAFLPNPVSLKQITGEEYDILRLAKQLCDYLEIRFQQLLQKSHTDLLNEYNSIIYKRNETVKLKQGSRVFETCIKGVDSRGCLLTRHSIEQAFEFGEVEWVL